MKIMTFEEGERWLGSAGVKSYQNRQQDFPKHTSTFCLPKDSGAKTALARLIVHEVFANKATVLLLKETGVWDSSENPYLFTKFREAVSDDKNTKYEPFDDYPFHYAEVSEAEAMEGLVALALYFIWDVTLFDRECEMLIRISHDEWIEIGSSDIAQFNDVTALFNRFGLVSLA